MKKKYNWLPDFVYGSIDGVVTTFAVVSGVKGADLSVTIILILGFANLLGDGFSMAVGKYLSDKSQVHDDVSPVLGGVVTFVSFVLVGLIPLLAYLFAPILNLSDDQTFKLTCIFTLFGLFIIGVVKGHVIKSSRLLGGAQTMLIGGLAALIAFYVSDFVERLI
mgnify:CR=1 FL=1